jgi:uncharacterized protein YcbK (DUF882 family)
LNRGATEVQTSSISRRRSRRSARHAALSLMLAAGLVAGSLRTTESAVANGDTRTINLYHLHTHEHLVITYKRDGQYIPAALRKLDWLLRDWRKGKAIHMDPRLYDLLWEVYHDVGATTQPIDIVCGYRAPATNAMLRGRSRNSGVAKHSQHTLGHAIDFFIPGVNLEKLREAGLRLERGGVGYYPKSGSPFVHMDVGNVRMWPRMSRAQLARVFPDGRTAYIPSDGKPMPGYQLALADIRERGYTTHKKFDFSAPRKVEMASNGRHPDLPEGMSNGGAAVVAPRQVAAAAPPLPKTVPLPSAAPVQTAMAEVPLPLMRPARLALASTADEGRRAEPPAVQAKRQLAAGLVALARHLPHEGGQPDPVTTGSIATAFADPASADGWAAQPRPEATGEFGAVSADEPARHGARSHAAAAHHPSAITRRIARAFASRLIAALSRPDGERAPMVSRPLNEASLRHLLASARLRDDTSSGMAHPEQIKIAALLAMPQRVGTANFTHAPLTAVWNDHFDGSAVAIVPTRSFAGDRSAAADTTTPDRQG